MESPPATDAPRQVVRPPGRMAPGNYPPPPSTEPPWIARRFESLSPRASAPKRALIAVAVVALLAGVLLDNGLRGVGLSTFIVCVVGALLVTSRPSKQSLAIMLVVASIAVMLAARESGWLRFGMFCLTALGLLTAAMLWKRGSLFNLPASRLLIAAVDTVLNALLTIPWIARGMRSQIPDRSLMRPAVVARIALIIVPMLVVVAVLLASSDALFARLIVFDPTSAVVFAILAAIGAFCCTLLLRIANLPAPSPPSVSAIGVSKLETSIALVGLAIVLGAFVGLQWVAELSVGRDALTSRGIDVAEHARSGYVQLLVAVFIVTTVLIAVDRIGRNTEGESQLLNRLLSLVVIGETLIVLAVTVRKIVLYCDAFGLTMLRLACVAGVAWIAVTLLLTALSLVGVGAHRSWLLGASGVALFAITLGFAALNPQRVVVEYNLSHAATVPLDLRYLTSMSSDAVPTLVTAIPQLGAADAAYVQRRLCPRYSKPVAWTNWNLSWQNAKNALEPVCPR